MTDALRLLSDDATGLGRPGSSSLPPATSSHKDKLLNEMDWMQLEAALAKGSSRYDEALLTYFRAACAAGLRPCEWAKARLDWQGTRHVLVVRNAKGTNGRSHGPYRRLVWDEEDDIEHIQAWLSYVSRVLSGTTGGERLEVWTTYRRALQDRLRAVCDHLWPRRKSHLVLYSARHTFTARIKAVNGTREVAALLGHAVDDTATHHYARASKGSRRPPNLGSLPRAHIRDVQRVRVTTDKAAIPERSRSALQVP
ncbi:hypothetical protein ABEG18_06310 [Alsobacter sp. KACC 23698]|uniref:Tyrosine-type recombinase/integrase n=1 Tax=Alsobacter sp. KACC 23698 TaxID=3149229 RepID=A0AAU7JJ06_9HYPH